MLLYAGDLLTVMNPGTGVPHLLKYIDSFRKISGYTINWIKSEFMFIFINLLECMAYRILEDFAPISDRPRKCH